MTSPSRAATRLRIVGLTVIIGLALSACGGTAEKATTTPKASTSTSTPSPTSTPVHGKTQVVKVTKYGVSFELPKGWITLDAKNVFKGDGKNPMLDELADRLGVSRDQLVRAFSTVVQTMSVSDAGAVHGFLDNVNSVGQNGDINDDQLKLQLATLGAKPGPITHVTTDAGDVTIVHYSLHSKTGFTARAVALAVRLGDATVVVTVTSSSDERATRIADQIQGSLKTIPGNGPNL